MCNPSDYGALQLTTAMLTLTLHPKYYISLITQSYTLDIVYFIISLSFM